MGNRKDGFCVLFGERMAMLQLIAQHSPHRIPFFRACADLQRRRGVLVLEASKVPRVDEP
jgi:hypothetical protein